MDLGISTFPSSPRPLYDRDAAAVEASIECLPAWVDKAVVKKTMSVKKRNSAGMVNKINFNKKVKSGMRDARYKRAYKLATDEAYSLEQKGLGGTKGNGLRAIAARYNTRYLADPGDRQLSRSALVRAVKERGEHGKSPPKLGRPVRVLPQITDQLAMQAAMMQASGEGEATTAKLEQSLTAMTAGTTHKDTFNNNYAVRKAMRLHPEVFGPVRAINDEDRRVDWLTYKNLNSWTDAVKKEMVDLGVVFDKPGFISKFRRAIFKTTSAPCLTFSVFLSLCVLVTDGVASEVTLGHPDDARRFVNIDETHHVFSNESDKGGTRARRYAASFITRSGDRKVRNGRHTTGCYATNAYGETLPPLYILDSKAKYPANYKIDTRVGVGLPRVYGRYGCTEPAWYPSFLAVRRKGGIDATLWEQVLEDLILPLHPNTSLEVVRCPKTNKILSGPLIVKTDAGPGRLCMEAKSWKFRARMWDAGIIILLGLPNGTSVNQEQDQGYQVYQPAVKASTQRVVSIKLADRVLARKKARLAKERNVPNVDDMPLLADLNDLDDILDGEYDEDEDAVYAHDGEEGGADDVEVDDEFDQLVAEQDAVVEYKKNLMNVGLGNLDLGHMVNGYPGDPIDKRPFDNSFRRPNVLRWWRQVGFLPMNRHALKDPKVRYELGEGGAPEEDGKRLALLEEAYKEGAAGLERLGLKGIDAFDVELPRATDIKFGEKDEKKIDEMMKDGNMKAG